MRILFLHGLESGPHGAKYQALKKEFADVISPDCSGISDPEQRLAIILAEIEKISGKFLVVGSSMGGLMALLLQRAAPERIGALLLCAPALHRPAARGLNTEGLPPTVIIHGIQDTVVPVAASRQLGTKLIEVEDDHSLKNSIPLIVEQARTLLKQKNQA